MPNPAAAHRPSTQALTPAELGATGSVRQHVGEELAALMAAPTPLLVSASPPGRLMTGELKAAAARHRIAPGGLLRHRGLNLDLAEQAATIMAGWGFPEGAAVEPLWEASQLDAKLNSQLPLMMASGQACARQLDEPAIRGLLRAVQQITEDGAAWLVSAMINASLVREDASMWLDALQACAPSGRSEGAAVMAAKLSTEPSLQRTLDAWGWYQRTAPLHGHLPELLCADPRLPLMKAWRTLGHRRERHGAVSAAGRAIRVLAEGGITVPDSESLQRVLDEQASGAREYRQKKACARLAWAPADGGGNRVLWVALGDENGPRGSMAWRVQPC